MGVTYIGSYEKRLHSQPLFHSGADFCLKERSWKKARKILSWYLTEHLPSLNWAKDMKYHFEYKYLKNAEELK